MSSRLPRLSSLLVVLLLPGVVLCLDDAYGSFKSKPVRQGVQKLASVFFGCSGLTPASANVSCTNLIQKLTKGVDCAIRVPLGTKATFSCLDNLTLSESYATVQCKMPGKWSPPPPKCISPQTVTDASLTEPVPSVNASLPTAATTIKALVTNATTTTPVPTTTEMLLLPIMTKRYPEVGLLSLYNDRRTLEASRALCVKKSAKLMYFDTPLALEATADLISLTPLAAIEINVGLDPVRTGVGNPYVTTWGVQVPAPKWCPGEGVDTFNIGCMFYANLPPSMDQYNHKCVVDDECVKTSHSICREP